MPEAKYSKIQIRLHQLLDPATVADTKSRLLDQFLSCLIVLNVIAVTLEFVPEVNNLYSNYFRFFEIISISIFSIEYMLRFWTSPITYRAVSQKCNWPRLRYVFSTNGMVDLLAISPFYLQFLMPGIDLRILRSLRLIRILKLSAYNSALSDLVEALNEERRAFFAAGYLFMLIFVLASSFIYFAEHSAQPNEFNSIPHAMYWALITITTVGYGDIAPVTHVGKFIAAASAISGVVVVALLTGIIASAFNTQMERRKAELENEIRRAFDDDFLDSKELQHIERIRKHFGISKRRTQELIEIIRLEKKPKG